ncbi:hypothetical protein A9Z61_03695 [Moraxella osloensis]|nr:MULTISPECIES: hypothetical protein [Moraxella]OBX58446.1 hypothetical protein A9Z61_03695 [Moraxella osloensis]
MNNYNFDVFSPTEFENFSRDLLQKHLGIYFQTFVDGRDNGIDLLSNKTQTIIQSKRYTKNFSQLMSSLKSEKIKVDELKPKRYILTTSVGLTPKNKDEIAKLLSPFILSTDDIYGKDDLNNLLNLYKNIELQYFKLWINSTNVLNKFIHSKIFNQTNFQREEIIEQSKFYVENQSLEDSINILNDNKCLIISGLPGVGKTTLANNIILRILDQIELDEFYYISSSIDEVYNVFVPDKKQLFYFDDFLGSNFLIDNLERNEDKRIIKLIERIQREKNKFIIFTTREYILKQAIIKYMALKSLNEEYGKYILDLASYTEEVKAKILYNHLFFKEADESFLLKFLKFRSYRKVVNHRNYSPRLVEAFVKEIALNNYQSIEDEDDFNDRIISLFDNPFNIWEESFKNHLSENDRIILTIIFSLNFINPTPLRIVKEVFFDEFKSTSMLDFDRSIETLEKCFITTTLLYSKDNLENHIILHNPSIGDFLINYFIKDSQYLINVLEKAKYIEQFLFANKYKNTSIKKFFEPKIVGYIIRSLENEEIPFFLSKDIAHVCERLTLIPISNDALNEVLLAIQPRLNAYIQKKNTFTESDINGIFTCWGNHSKFQIEDEDFIELFKKILASKYDLGILVAMHKLKCLNGELFEEITNLYKVSELVSDEINCLVENSSRDSIEDDISFLREINEIELYGLNFDEDIKTLEERLSDWEWENESLEDIEYTKEDNNQKDEFNIDELFQRMIEK